jgi:hypothetical protein
MIDQKQNKIEVADLMDINSGRYYAVNFLNLYFGRTGIVEFRMAPASNGPDEALAWIQFSTTFTKAAILVGSKLTQYGRNVGEMILFLELGDIEGVTSPDFRNPISREVEKPSKIIPSLGSMSPQRQALFSEKQRQDQNKNIMAANSRSFLFLFACFSLCFSPFLFFPVCLFPVYPPPVFSFSFSFSFLLSANL